MDIRIEGDDMSDFYEPYDGEISDYLLRARKWIGRADVLAINGTSEDQARASSMATVGVAHALLAAVIMLVKESPPSD